MEVKKTDQTQQDSSLGQLFKNDPTNLDDRERLEEEHARLLEELEHIRSGSNSNSVVTTSDFQDDTPSNPVEAFIQARIDQIRGKIENPRF